MFSLQKSVSNLGGNIAYIGPEKAGETWTIQRFAASASSTVGTLDIFLNSVNPTNLIDSTRKAYQDISETNFIVESGNNLIFVWNATTPNVIYTCAIYGAVKYGI